MILKENLREQRIHEKKKRKKNSHDSILGDKQHCAMIPQSSAWVR